MRGGVKAVSTYRGRDPRDFVLFAFGGSGPIAATEIARALGMRHVLVPPAPGLFSAFGLLFTEIEHEFLKTFFLRGDEIEPQRVDQAFRALEDEAQAVMAAEGYVPERVRIARFADMRYSGQAYELVVPVAAGAPDVGAMIRGFSAEHERTYGHSSDADPVDLVNVKVVARGLADGVRGYDATALARRRGRGARRPAYFGAEIGLVETPVLERGDLAAAPQAGPFIVEEYDATCVVPPGFHAALAALGNVDIRVG